MTCVARCACLLGFLDGAQGARVLLGLKVRPLFRASNAARLMGTLAMPKLLVANRGEIACRVITSAKRLGVPTVAVYSDADRLARHVQLADESFNIGPPPARDSYLRGHVILEIAKKTGATAIHPGYGFLSENAAFSELCEQEGIRFVGPSASAIRAMGDKSQAKHIMSSAGVPVVPGYHGEDQSEERLFNEAVGVGFPLLVKAVSGGGGKGMKIAMDESQVEEALASARREAIASFGDDRLLVERYITKPRHIEVQVIADQHGNVVYLFDRDCSVQRRHQKVLEEAPAPGLSMEFHKMIGEAAVQAARAVGYVNAGTVEFIVDTITNEFFFMEMNTRLQVEHPVTEAIVGQDLVELQLRVASGEALPFNQEDLKPNGHAFEARLYAESPRKDFLPGAGRVSVWQVPPGAVSFTHQGDVRVDSGVTAGDEVGTNYDPMIAKLVTWGVDRPAALAKMREALAQTQVAGLPTNLSFLQRLAAHPAFESAADLSTAFIKTHMKELMAPQELSPRVIALLAVARCLAHAKQQRSACPPRALAGLGPWGVPSGKRLWYRLSRQLVMTCPEADNCEVKCTVTWISDSTLEVAVPPEPHPLIVRGAQLREGTGGSQLLVCEVAGRRVEAAFVLGRSGGGREESLSLWLDGSMYDMRWPIPQWDETIDAPAHGNKVLAPMPGRVVKVLVSEGESVSAGSHLLLVEAMKMEHVLKAPISGKVAGLAASTGMQVTDGQLLLYIDEEKAAGQEKEVHHKKKKHQH